MLIFNMSYQFYLFMVSYMFWICQEGLKSEVVLTTWVANNSFGQHHPGWVERCWSLVKSGSFLWTTDKQRRGSVRLFQTWFCESPLPSWLSQLSEWERHSERHPFWLTALRHCRCRFITRSKRPVQCLGQNDRHVTSKHSVGFDTIQKVKKIYKFDFVL